MSIIDRRGITVDGTPSSAAASDPNANKAIKTPCRVATTANITLSGLQTIDGVTVVANDRVLVKDQSSAIENGIYTASTGNWTRAVDVDGAYDVLKGTIVNINEGAVSGVKQYICSSNDPLTPGTSSLSFTVISYQPVDATLTALAALNSAADKLPYFTGSDTASLANFSSFARTLVDDADQATMRTTLGLTPGTDVQAYDADLAALAANSTDGLWAHTGAGTGAARTLTAPAAGITITNPAGIAGNPTLVLANDLSALEGLATSGHARRTGTDTWAIDVPGQLTATATNDDAAAGKLGEYRNSILPNTNATVTITIASPGVVTWTAHGYSTNSPCAFVPTTSGALPTGLTAGTVYWTIPSTVTTNTFQLATSIANALAGTAINTTGSQSGTHTGTSRLAATTNVALTYAAVSLPAGDWDLGGSLQFALGATTNVTYVAGGSGLTLDTFTTATGTFVTQLYGTGSVLGNAATLAFAVPITRISTSSTITLYATYIAGFTVSTVNVSGNLWARRVR